MTSQRDHPRHHEVLDRVDRHRLHRVHLLGDAHGAELGGDGAAGARVDHQRGEDRGQLAGERERDRAAAEGLGARTASTRSSIWSANTIPANVPVTPTMNAEPTPMKAIWARTSSSTERRADGPRDHLDREKDHPPEVLERGLETTDRRALSHASARRAAFPEAVAARPPIAILARPMVKVGGEVDAFCTKCQLTLAHTVHAVVSGRPVKVECNTCHGVHRYRDPPGGRPFAPPARASTPGAREGAGHRVRGPPRWQGSLGRADLTRRSAPTR